MRNFTLLFFLTITFISCDCVQQATGIALDRQTNQPINSVSLGKYEKEDINNPKSRRRFTDVSGKFNYHSISGGRRCPDLVLFFSKTGYRTTMITFPSFSQNDTVYLDKIATQAISKLDSIERTNNESVIASGDKITKAIVFLKDGDSSIHLTANIRQDHRIFGFVNPDIKSVRLLLLSVFTNDVEGNPFGCKFGSYYDTGGMKSFTLKYVGTNGDFVKAAIIDNLNKSTLIYFEKKWIKFD